MTRPHLTCVHIQGNKVSSSDNWRITQAIIPEPSPFDFLFPASSVDLLSKYKLNSMTINGPWCHFKADNGLLLSIRLRAGDLISVDEFFNVTGIQIHFPPQLKEAINRTKIMVDGESVLDMKVTLVLENGKITCHGRKSIGWIEETVDIDYQGPKVELSINPVFLLTVLDHTNKVIIGDTCCLLWGEDFRHVMMLMES